MTLTPEQKARGLEGLLDAQGHRPDCAIRLPHPASICTCHIADKQRAETFTAALRTKKDHPDD